MNADKLQLRDIHLPDPVSWWPPAVGWWILIGCILCVMAAGIWWLRRTMAIRQAPATIARDELEKLRAAWLQHHDDQRLVNELSTWLRRAGMSLSSRHQAASATGEQWWQVLDTIAGEPVFDAEDGRLLVEAPYRVASPESPSPDGRRLLDLCERWLDAASRRKHSK